MSAACLLTVDAGGRHLQSVCSLGLLLPGNFTAGLSEENGGRDIESQVAMDQLFIVPQGVAPCWRPASMLLHASYMEMAS